MHFTNLVLFPYRMINIDLLYLISCLLKFSDKIYFITLILMLSLFGDFPKIKSLEKMAKLLLIPIYFYQNSKPPEFS